MRLSKAAVLKAMSPTVAVEKRLVIAPYSWDPKPPKTAPASIDVHLGNRFVFLRRGRSVLQDPLNLTNTSGVFENPEAHGTEIFLPFGAPLYLHPGQLVLGTTLEWIRLPSTLTAHVDGRSIWGRRGLIVVTASAVQPGTAGTITLELTNLSEVAVVVSPGAAVAQLLFDEVEETELRGRRPPFVVGNKPIFGRYRPSRVEKALLGR